MTPGFIWLNTGYDGDVAVLHDLVHLGVQVEAQTVLYLRGVNYVIETKRGQHTGSFKENAIISIDDIWVFFYLGLRALDP